MFIRAVDEGRVGRLGHGPGDPGHQPARRLHAGRRRAAARSRTCASPSCASAAAPTTTRWSTSRSRPRSTCTAIRSWPPPRRRARPATRPTRCWPPLPASWARAGSAGARRATETLLDLFLHQVSDAARRGARASTASQRDAVAWSAPRRDARAAALLAALEARGGQVGVRALPAQPRRASHGRCGAGRDRADAGLGAAAAQAHQPAHGRQPALVSGALRQADRRLGPRRPARAPAASAASRRRDPAPAGPPPSSPAWR